VELRPVQRSDVPAILELIGEVYAEYGCVLRAELEERHLLEPDVYFRRTGGEFWVLHEAGALRATCGVLLHPDSAELKSLYVHRSIRRQGWGRRLTLMVIDYARQHGRPRVILWSDTRFLDAHRLYRKLGFVQEGARELHDSNQSVEYGFSLALGGVPHQA
jgi:GNAT superfamily N-acetyltransferase